MPMQTFEEKFLLIQEEFEALIERGTDLEIHNFTEDLHTADLSELLMDLSDQDRDRVFGLLSDELAIGVLEEINPEDFSELIKLLTPFKKRLLLDQMGMDDIVDKLEELPEDRVREIILLLDTEDREDVRELLVYEEDTAGRMMTKDFVSIEKEYTAYYAIDYLREVAKDVETIYYVYVVDREERLVGVLSLKELLVSSPSKKVEEIMSENVKYVHVEDDQEEVAKVVSKYGLLAIPVVDSTHELMGIVTVDDVIDVIEEEATEDIYKFVGSSDLESDDDEESLHIRIYNSVRSRLPWLIITIMGGLLSSTIVGHFKFIIDYNTTLTLFTPVLAGMGGNVGTQSSTITVRSIATGQIYGDEIWKTIIQETGVGLSVGLICSAIMLVSVTLLQGDPILSLIVGLGMFANIMTAALLGTLVPLIFRRIGIDPAVASAPFITTTIDAVGLSIYYSLAVLMLMQL